MIEIEKSTVRRITDTVIWRGFLWLGAIVIANLLLSSALTFFEVGFDSTDSDKERSGLSIMTDSKTGCEYLSTANGGLTPRLDVSGLPICNK